MMHLVTGTTEQYVYPTERIIDPTFTIGDYIQLCGGFYQGYYKIDGSTYQLLPTRVNQAWAAEFWLNPQDICAPTTGTTLNDVYPNNKGFFFYMGTRAENKFWNQFYGNDTGCTSGCTVNTGDTSCSAFTGSVSTFCTIPKENDIIYAREGSIGLATFIPKDKNICLGQRVMLFRASKAIFHFYLIYAVTDTGYKNRLLKKHRGMGAKHVNVKDIVESLIALPPLSEQIRIVQKLDELMQTCDELEASIKESQAQNEKLLQQVLREALRR
jgi:hypothetical protein